MRVTKNDPVYIDSADIVFVKPSQSSVIQVCCDCGLTHEIKIIDAHTGLRLQFVNLGHRPNLERFEFETSIEPPRASDDQA